MVCQEKVNIDYFVNIFLFIYLIGYFVFYFFFLYNILLIDLLLTQFLAVRNDRNKKKSKLEPTNENSNDPQPTDTSFQNQKSSSTSPQQSPRPPTSTTPLQNTNINTTTTTSIIVSKKPKITEINVSSIKNNPLIENADRKLGEQDEKLLETCLQLHKQTFKLTCEVEEGDKKKSWKCTDEFSQLGIKQCVTFCMQLPGNRDLCTEDRAKLLKYGAYEIVLIRLATRYSLLDDKILLTNGETVDENDLMQHAFGCYGHTFFQYCRHLNKFNLTNEELALFQCCIFYTYDRPLLKDRQKVEQLQMRYCELLRYSCANNHKNDEMFFSKLLLSMMKLRALDALSKKRKIITLNILLLIIFFSAAERMLNLILSVETNVEGYVYEVLHREYLNIVADFEINSMDAIDTNPDYTWLLSSTNILENKNIINDKPTVVTQLVKKEEPQNLDTINYDDLIDCLTTVPKSEQQQTVIKQSSIQNLNEIFNKQQEPNSSGTLNLVDSGQSQLNLYSQAQTNYHLSSHNHHHHHQPQMLMLVSGGFLSVVKNNS